MSTAAAVFAVDEERDARVFFPIGVYCPGWEPIDWHMFCWRLLPVNRSCAGGDAASASLVPAAAERSSSRSRSLRRALAPSRFSRLGSGRAPLAEGWNWHYDGRDRRFRNGYVLGVDDALVEGDSDRYRSVFVDAFSSNRVLRGEDILDQCLLHHLDGYSWRRIEYMCRALRCIALTELREGSAGVLELLRNDAQVHS